MSHPLKIMILHENPEFLSFLGASLRDMGMDCIPVQDKNDALSSFSSSSPNLVLIGQLSRSGDALDVLKAFREVRSDVPIVLASPQLDTGTACEAVSLGVRALLPRDPELRDILVIADEEEKKAMEEVSLKEQHSRLAFEYARLKLAFDDLRRKS